MELALKTHIGHIRQVNEDSAAHFTLENGPSLVVVADGMGGHQAGDVASKMAVDGLITRFKELEQPFDTEQRWSEWLVEVISEINQDIYQNAQEQEHLYGMGTTLICGLFLPESYVIGHVGDSRVYRAQRDKLELITEDHSLVNELLKSGQITELEAALHPQRSAITRALGIDSQVKVDVHTYFYAEPEQEEKLIFCSDGLSDRITADKMREILSASTTLVTQADELLQAALDAGGEDNITVLIVQLKGEQQEEK